MTALAPAKRKLAAGTFWLVSGPSEVKVISGDVRSTGAKIPAGTAVSVPVAKRLPLEAAAASEVETDGTDVTRLEADPVPSEWRKAVESLAGRGRVVVIGDLDTGKSFFTTWLANVLFERGRRVAVLDGDLGQSDVAPPGCLGLLLMNDPAPFLSASVPTAIQYIGSHTPSGFFEPFMAGLGRLAGKAAERGAERLIVNTPGWISGEGGLALQRGIVAAVKPDAIVVLQRGDEAEAVAKAFNQDVVVRLKAPAGAERTSTETRTRYREELSKSYYANRRFLVIPFHYANSTGARFLKGLEAKPKSCAKVLFAEKFTAQGGAQVIVSEALTAGEERAVKQELGVGELRQVALGTERGVQVGLADENGETMALGVIERFTLGQGGTAPNYVEIWTPLAIGKESRVKILQFGTLKLAPSGEEAGAIEAGAL